LIKENSISKSVNDIKDVNLLREIENLRISYRQQNFWKYHIIKIAPFEFYMTTNPDKRHRFVRNAPSYFIKLEMPNESKDTQNNNKLVNSLKNQSQVTKGYRLIFTQQQVVGVNRYDGYYQPFIIEKLPKSAGGHYKVNCQYNEFQSDWNILNNVNNESKNSQRNLHFQFSNKSFKGKDGDKEKDNDKSKNKDKDKGKEEIYDVNNELVLYDDYIMGDYLHVCSIKEKKKSIFIKSKIDGVKLAKNNSVYFLDTGFFKKRKWFDPVVSVFRPCNRGTKNKITKSVLINSKLNMNSMNMNSSKKLFSANKLNVDFSNLSLKGNTTNKETNEDGSRGGDPDGVDADDDDDDEYDYDDIDDDENSENVIDSENSKTGNYSKFYNAKDGFYDRHPKDDSPNDHKIGWLTIYEKGRYFEKIPNGGNWQMVLGMTYAVAFEKLIDKYLKEVNEML
jgi:hypothetical protein